MTLVKLFASLNILLLLAVETTSNIQQNSFNISNRIVPFGNLTRGSKVYGVPSTDGDKPPSNSTTNNAGDDQWIIPNLILLSLGLIANYLVMVLSHWTWKISTHYKLTTCLAVSDALYCTLFLILNCLKAAGSLPSLGIGCKLLFSLILCNYFSDVGLVLLLSTDRYISICHPLKGGLKLKYVYAIILAIALVSLFSVIPMMVNLCETTSDMVFYKGFAWYQFTVVALLPCIILAVLYYKSISTLYSITESILHCSNDATFQRRQKENKRILAIIITLVVTFFILLVPSSVMYIIGFYVPLSPFWKEFISVYTENVFPLHTIFNPIIYSLVDKRIRKIISNFSITGINRRQSSEVVSLKTLATVV